MDYTEVGGAPQKFAVAPDELHSWAGAIQRSHPATMTLGSTHDLGPVGAEEAAALAQAHLNRTVDHAPR